MIFAAMNFLKLLQSLLAKTSLQIQKDFYFNIKAFASFLKQAFFYKNDRKEHYTNIIFVR